MIRGHPRPVTLPAMFGSRWGFVSPTLPFLVTQSAASLSVKCFLYPVCGARVCCRSERVVYTPVISERFAPRNSILLTPVATRAPNYDEGFRFDTAAFDDTSSSQHLAGDNYGPIIGTDVPNR